MREENISRRQGVGLDNCGRMEHSYRAERNSRATEGIAQQWYKKGRGRGDGSKHGSVGARQNSRGWTGSDIGAEGHGNREVKAEGGQRSHRHPSSALASIILAQPC